MKFINFYSGTALVLIASLLGSLGSTTGELAPPLVLAALLATVLVLGWAGGASDARHEVDRLTKLEAGRQLQMACNAAARDRLETAAEVLRTQVRDSQAAIELFTAAQARNMIRITSLEGENAELSKRPVIDIAPGAAGGVDHENDMTVDSFAADIKAKLATRSAAGGGAWNDPAQCSIKHLQGVLVEWAAKGDPVSVGALAMMIHQRGGRTALSDWCPECHARDSTPEKKPSALDVRLLKRFGWPGGMGDWFQQLPNGPYVLLEDVLPMIEASAPAGPASPLPANALFALLSLQPLVEPVYIGKALRAHREARVVLDGGTGPKAAVFLVNISLTPWTYTKETAEAYARGWNSGVQALRGALTEAVVGKLLSAAPAESE